ncbi:cell growth regulator with EF hand domain protein 1-like [Myxocyprinus asiaticus]|uniref:cell growth regulator with EF hand domain protein 1-like n=1 Tax=Myxocyprinus asiaticus TaxID=70543 RepID=UPI002221BE36|nr:cell growth regulator with EF hand domain protein 1-like [Myxocyprinus asiaticus]XP_051502115.1 cell growth regulator with EF hand domain protein 1-like [Myxocyprinus asiaticus]XP_051502116.1 cell growth regulator with EF hand domain protein 1-like [Myxocyprinus asiaticus]XP_051502117.1 cell growth regulator with EF hand domain protein 1-like [Myxocyprinus asiaticus]
MKTHGVLPHSSAGVGLAEHRCIMERLLTAAERGEPKKPNGVVNMIIARLLFLLILPSLGMCAPQVQKTSSDGILPTDLANPFGSSEDNHRLLQSYIKSNLKEGQANLELKTREQEVFFLFSLYDYDRSGQMDGLELMQLLTDFLSHHALMPKSTDSVVSLVDYLLQTEDLNQDGLLAPSELLSSSTQDHQQENNIVPPDAPAELVEDNLKQEQTDTKTEGGDAETHQQVAEVKDNLQEPGQKQL